MNKMLLVAFAPFVLVSCVAPADDSQDEAWDDSEEVVGESQLGMGGNPATGGNEESGFWQLNPTTLAQLPAIAAAPLDQGNGFLPGVNFGHSHGYEVWRNIVYCALGVDQTLTDPSTGAVHRGHFGLAMSWKNAALTASQQRWVTACMLQRLNAYGHSVPILLEGMTSPIYYYQPDDSAYPWNESTAWGNVFSPAGPAVYVCSDSDLIATCEAQGKTASAWLQERICDGVANCGMVYMGTCATACKYQVTSRGTYPVCTVNGVTYNETVHVQLPSTEATCTPL